MSTMLWHKICPLCNEGRLFVFKNLNEDKLYLHCEECERAYADLENLKTENSFLTLAENFEAIAATAEDIKNYNWDISRFHVLHE